MIKSSCVTSQKKKKQNGRIDFPPPWEDHFDGKQRFKRFGCFFGLTPAVSTLNRVLATFWAWTIVLINKRFGATFADQLDKSSFTAPSPVGSCRVVNKYLRFARAIRQLPPTPLRARLRRHDRKMHFVKQGLGSCPNRPFQWANFKTFLQLDRFIVYIKAQQKSTLVPQ